MTVEKIKEQKTQKKCVTKRKLKFENLKPVWNQVKYLIIK